LENEFVKEIVVILFVAFIGGYIFIRLKQPPFVGYLLSGIIISLPFFSGIIRFDVAKDVAQIGVALLLFAVGIEFPISKIFSIRKTLLIGTLVQLGVFIFIARFVFSFIGFSSREALFLSIAFTNSSTIVVIPLLEKKLFKGSKVSDYVIGWLILQDIAIIVIAVLAGTLLSNDPYSTYDVLEAIAKSFVFITISIILGKQLIPDVFNALSRIKSFELLLVLAFVFCMTVAFIAESLGLSFTLGAFLAGVMISESLVNHEIFSETKSLRDLFSPIYYVALGSLISITFVLQNIIKIVILVIIVLFVKFLIILGIVTSLEKQTRKAFLVALLLMQSGEFAFILSQLGLQNQWIGEEIYSLAIVVTVISLIITPFAVGYSEKWYICFQEFVKKRSPGIYNRLFISLNLSGQLEKSDEYPTVILCGFGRVGSYVGKALDKSQISFLVIDTDREVIDYCKGRGYQAMVGDAASSEILNKAQVDKAHFLVVALPKEAAAELVSSHARKLNPNIKIIARSHIPTDDIRLKQKGADITVEPEFEAAISISKKILALTGKSGIDVTKYLKKSRRRKRSKYKKG